MNVQWRNQGGGIGAVAPPRNIYVITGKRAPMGEKRIFCF